MAGFFIMYIKVSELPRIPASTYPIGNPLNKSKSNIR